MHSPAPQYICYLHKHILHMCAYACQNFLINEKKKRKEDENGLGHLENLINISKVLPLSRFVYIKNIFAWLQYEPSFKKKKKKSKKLHTLMAVGTR